jgi:hypothetical protein
MKNNVIAFVLAFGLQASAQAQMVEVNDSGTTKPATGKAAAAEYFKKRKPAAKKTDDEGSREPASEGGGSKARYLAIHVGAFVDDQAYKWGHGDQSKVGDFNLGVTYRVGEWVNSADFVMRVEYTNYSLDEGAARKLGVIAMITFPDANSKFPLYFGAGVGPGFFIKQIHGQSVMSVDYEVVAGARFLNVFDNLGFFAEFGLKNDIHIFSEGQYNGLFVGGGTVWMF